MKSAVISLAEDGKRAINSPQTIYASHSICTPRVLRMTGICILIAAAICILISAPSTSWAVTSEEKQAEADAIYTRIDELQTELNAANAEYKDALQKQTKAENLKDEAQLQVDQAQSRIDELQERLGDRAVELYQSRGATPFLEVILGSSTFEEFLNNWTMLARVTSKDAKLIEETKSVREEAEASRSEYEAQQQKATEEMERAQKAEREIKDKQESLTKEAQSISAEVAELKAAEARAAQSVAGASVVTGNGRFSHPLPGGTMTSTFGYRDFRGSEYHGGVDFAAELGTPYYAADDGTVVTAFNDGGWHGGCGNEIVISHGDGLYSIYMHSSTVYVTAGQHVTRGQNIGAVGSTGDSTGPHLHFQVELNGERVNPLSYL